MIRILFFLVVVFALGLGFAWLADRPGTMVVEFQGMEYQVTLLVAAVGVVAVVVAVMLSWWVLKSLWNSPRAVSRYFRARKRDRGYQSLSTGMIAAGAGDAELARRMNKQALQNLSSDQEPLIHLLEAQTLLLEGDTSGARKKFEAMLDDPETRVLGLRGLYLEAQREGEPAAARHYAEQAAHEAPQLGWASNAALEARVAEGDWDQALRLLERQGSTRQITKEAANRRRAVLLTARAMEQLDADPTNARNAALEAVKLTPDLVPASITAAKALVRLNDFRKAAKVLEAIWKKEPHPEVAQTYLHLRPGDSAHDRLKRARKLESLRTYNPESSMAVARAAYEAGEFDEARRAIESALKQQPREGAYLLLADIEEDETGDQGRIRHWLGQAVRAPRDPAWTADGYISEKWAPFSPVTGKIDAFEWRVPVERITPAIEAGEPEEGEPAIPAIPIMVPAAPAIDKTEPPVDVEVMQETGGISDESTVMAAGSDDEQAMESAETAEAPAGEGAADRKAPLASEGEGPSGESEMVEILPPDIAAEKKKVAEKEIHPQPDDPGVDPNRAPTEPTSRFRLF